MVAQMNNDNEPVAWMSSVGGEFVYVGYEPAEGYLAIPLYTHPAKTLTDRIAELEKQVGIWEKEAMNARIKMSLYQAEIKELRKDLSKYDELAIYDLKGKAQAK